MEKITLYESFWKEGLEPELIEFFDGLNWFYIIMFIAILHGIKHTKEFGWYNRLCNKFNVIEYKNWIAAFLTACIFCFFRWKDPELDFNIPYITAMLRSMFFAVIFSGVFVDIPVVIIKRLGKIIDVNDEGKKES